MQARQKKITVVDDEIDILMALQAILEDAGYLVVTADKGEYLEQMDIRELPDLILLDVLLSGKDGREIAKFLRNQPGTKNIPLLMMSAHPGAEATTRACGATDFIAKPFDMDILLAKIAQYI